MQTFRIILLLPNAKGLKYSIRVLKKSKILEYSLLRKDVEFSINDDIIILLKT